MAALGRERGPHAGWRRAARDLLQPGAQLRAETVRVVGRGGQGVQPARVEQHVHQPARAVEPAPHPVVGPPGCLAERAEVVQLQTGELVPGQGPGIQGGPGVRAHLDQLQRLVGHDAVGLHDIARHVQVEQTGGHGVHPVTTSRAGQVAEQVGHERDRCIWLVARHLAQVRQQGAQAEQYRGQVTPRLAGAAVRHVRPEARLRHGGGGLVGGCGQAGLRTRRRGGTEHPVDGVGWRRLRAGWHGLADRQPEPAQRALAAGRHQRVGPAQHGQDGGPGIIERFAAGRVHRAVVADPGQFGRQDAERGAGRGLLSALRVGAEPGRAAVRRTPASAGPGHHLVGCGPGQPVGAPGPVTG